jgi:hypothetical protein
MIFGGGKPAHRLIVRNNYTYYPAQSGGRGADIGYVLPCRDALVADNMFVGTTSIDLKCEASTFSGNRLFGAVVDPAGTLDRSNVVLSTPPTQADVFVRPNKYETGRAHIVIYNWSRLSSVAVDTALLRRADGRPMLAPGDRYELRDAQNFFGEPVAAGTYQGETALLVPMTGLEAAQPVGASRHLPHTGPDFGTFVLLTHR